MIPIIILMDILVFINPISGKGKSEEIFEKVKHLFDTKFKITVVRTKDSNTITNYIENCKLNTGKLPNYKAIIGCGGDGTIFQIINSLKRCKLDIPIAEIPTGSSNGYFRCISNKLSLANTCDNAIKIINKFNPKRVNLLEIENDAIFARLSISWGIISDIDVNTERLRKLGPLRFDIGAIYYILKKNCYKGVLTLISDGKTHVVEGDFIYFWACNVEYATSDVKCAPGAKIDDNKIHVTYIKSDVSRCELISMMLNFGTEKFFSNEKVVKVQVDGFKLETYAGQIVVDGERLKVKTIDVRLLNEGNFILI